MPSSNSKRINSMFSFSMAAISADRFKGSTQFRSKSSGLSLNSSIMLHSIKKNRPCYVMSIIQRFFIFGNYRLTPAQSPRSAVSKNFFSTGVRIYSSVSLIESYGSLTRSESFKSPELDEVTRFSLDSEVDFMMIA